MSRIPLGAILNVIMGFHDCPLLTSVYIAALCGCHESTATSCELSINNLPTLCGSPTVFNKYVMVMFRNFLLHPISNFQYKSLYISHWCNWSNIHFTYTIWNVGVILLKQAGRFCATLLLIWFQLNVSTIQLGVMLSYVFLPKYIVLWMFLWDSMIVHFWQVYI